MAEHYRLAQWWIKTLRERFPDLEVSETDRGFTVSVKRPHMTDRAIFVAKAYRPERDGRVGGYALTEELLNEIIVTLSNIDVTVLPAATHEGVLVVGGLTIKTYVLKGGERLLDADDVQAFFAAISAGDLGEGAEQDQEIEKLARFISGKDGQA